MGGRRKVPTFILALFPTNLIAPVLLYLIMPDKPPGKLNCVRAPQISLLLLLFSLLASTGIAQDFDRYQPLQSAGELPDFLLRRTSEKYEAERSKLDRRGDKIELRAKEEFLLQSNYTLDDILLSGKVLYNDPVGGYLNDLKDYLLREQPEARDSIRVFLVRSPQVNAFCTNNGIVLVHAGLLNKVGSEAQLAYILCHEFQHYLQQHPINRFVRTQTDLQQRRIVSVNDYEDFLLAKNRYSRDQELEADSVGLDLYLESAFAAGEAEKVFEVMRYSYLPYEEREFPLSFFETDHFWLPPYLQLDEVQEISAREDYDDSEMDHPNIATRREVVERKMVRVEDLEGPTHIFAPERFQLAQKTCRYEMVDLYLKNERYEHAIYQAFLLQQHDPNGYFLRNSIAEALYALTLHRNGNSFYDIHLEYDEIEGESQQLFYLFEKLSKSELTALTVNYLWQLHQEYPEDPIFYDQAMDVLEKFIENNEIYSKRMERAATGMSIEEMFAEVVEEEVEMVDGQIKSRTLTTLMEADEEEEVEKEIGATDTLESDSLPDKVIGLADVYPVDDGEQDPRDRKREAQLALQKRLDDHRSRDHYFLYSAFVDLFQDPEFERIYDRKMVDWDQDEGIWSSREDDIDPELDVDTREFRMNRKTGLTLNLDKVIYLTPMVRKVNEKSEEVDYLGGEAGQMQFTDLIEEMADLTGLEVEMLSTINLKKDDTKRFNDMVTLRSWLGAKLENGPESTVPNPYQAEAEQLLEGYGTRYIGITGGIIADRSYMDRAELRSALYAFYGVVTIPFSLYYIIKPKRKVYYVNWLWDVKTGKMVMDETRMIRGKATPRRLKSAFYYSFLQIKSQP